MEETPFITPIVKEVLGYGILGVYSLVASYFCFRLYRQLTAVYERLISKRDSRRDQELKVLDELSELSKELISVSETLERLMNYAHRSSGHDTDKGRK